MYNFKEKLLGEDFCKKDILETKKLISSSLSFTVVGMPGMGISMFLRYLVTHLEKNSKYFVVHVDVNELPELTKEALFKLLDKELGGKSKEKLEQITVNKKVVIIFNRFDNLKKDFDYNFFANLRSIRDIDKENIVMIFSANRSLTETASESITGGNLNMFSKTYYLKPFSLKDLDRLVKLNTPNLVEQQNYHECLEKSGGHYQLLQLLLKNDEKAIDLQLKELFNFLNYHQRKQLQMVALNKIIKQPDSFLINLQLIHGRGIDVKTFTPLLTDYIKSHLRLKLPAKENQLFNLLKRNPGKVITKDEIFNALWSDGDGSDWALDALIYRLRKNPTFAANYSIESQKKVGYIFVRLS